MKYLSILLFTFLLVSCSGNEKPQPELKSVYVTNPETDGSGNSLIFAGVLEENENISLSFKTPGQIKRIFVKEGSHVHAGQLLAELDASDYKLGVEAVQIQYDQLSQEIDRAKKLYDKKSMSANDYEKAVAGLRQLAVQLQANKNKLAYTRLYAPASGIIESVNFAPSEMVDAGTAVFNMLDTHGLEVVCDIPAQAYLQRGSFSGFSCRPTRGDGTSYPLRLLGIVPKADGNQLYRMRLALGGNTAAGLTSGMNVEVSVRINPENQTAMTVPASSLFRRGDKNCVWIVKADSAVTARVVEPEGTVNGETAVIRSGLSPDDVIVRAGVSMLHEGEKVKIIDKPSETNVGGLL